jgi:hypothetical protein
MARNAGQQTGKKRKKKGKAIVMRRKKGKKKREGEKQKERGIRSTEEPWEKPYSAEESNAVQLYLGYLMADSLCCCTMGKDPLILKPNVCSSRY